MHVGTNGLMKFDNVDPRKEHDGSGSAILICNELCLYVCFTETEIKNILGTDPHEKRLWHNVMNCLQFECNYFLF